MYVSYKLAGSQLRDRAPVGARAANLLIEQPTKSELVIDLKIAKRLGLTIPQSLLLPQGSEPRRPADRASNQVRVVRESQDSKSTGLKIPQPLLLRADEVIQ